MLSRRSLFKWLAGSVVAAPLVAKAEDEVADGVALNSCSHPELSPDSLEYIEINIEGSKAFLPVWK